jgi:hypothetical protein
VDPWGEHGEYHSFVFDGPVFHPPVRVRMGEVVLRDVRFFADLLPEDTSEEEPAGKPVDQDASAITTQVSPCTIRSRTRNPNGSR